MLQFSETFTIILHSFIKLLYDELNNILLQIEKCRYISEFDCQNFDSNLYYERRDRELTKEIQAILKDITVASLIAEDKYLFQE